MTGVTFELKFVVRIAAGVLMLLSACLLTGSVDREDPALARLQIQGYRAVKTADYRTAASSFERAYQLAQEKHDSRRAAKFLSNLAGAKLSLFQYQEALDAFLAARKLARSSESRDVESGIDINLAGLYMQFGDLEAADRFADQALKGLNKNDPYHFRHHLLATRALILARQGDPNRSVSYFLEAIIDAAQERVVNGHGRQRDINAMAMDWDLLGDEMLLRGDKTAASQAFLAAFHLRSMFHDRDLRLSYVRLSWLHLEQGDVKIAASFMDKADSMPATNASLDPWLTLYWRGRILDATGDRRAALGLFRQALVAARQFQRQAAPGGIPAEYAQRRLKMLYADIVNTSLSLDERGLDGFEATEEDRRLALLQTLTSTGAFLKKAPPEYWATLAQLRDIQGQALVRDDSRTSVRISKIKDNLAQIETKAGLSYLRNITDNNSERNTASITLSHIQRDLESDEALLSFHVGRECSALWAVTVDRIALYRLPAEPVLSKLIAKFRQAVERRSPDRDKLGSLLYEQLFKDLSPEFRAKRVWVITAEDSFFEIPLTALVVDWKEGKPVYLIEQHTIMHSPSAGMLKRASRTVPTGPFLGVGDGIYNTADPRWKGGWKGGWNGSAGFMRVLPVSFGSTRPKLELARLAGSGKEIAACARAWGHGTPMLLNGATASRKYLQAALRARPSVVHIASHFVTLPRQPDEALIDLGLTADGSPELLNEKDVASLQATDATVVMSGCSSGNGGAIPTAGVLGLTRAWLIAGARAVVGSRWPTPDDTGELFRAFYLELGGHGANPVPARAVAEALHDAQIEMLRSKTWRSDPSYWGAFYVVGKE